MDPEDHYQLLSEDDEQNQKLKEASRARNRSFSWFLSLGGVLLIIVSISSYVLPSKQTDVEVRRIWTDCGRTPDEARRRGCKFDLLSFAWQTAECFDEEVHEQFLAYSEWEFYTTKLGNETLPLEVARLGDRTLYTTETYHFVHCTFMWMQLHRSYTVLGYIDSHLDAYNHTLHCQGILFRRGNPPTKVTTIGVLKYPSCRQIW